MNAKSNLLIIVISIRKEMGFLHFMSQPRFKEDFVFRYFELNNKAHKHHVFLLPRLAILEIKKIDTWFRNCQTLNSFDERLCLTN